MAQIIRLRRGTLAELNSVTLQNGEIGIVTGSAVIGDAALKTAVVIGHSDGTNRLSIARVITGNATPDLSGVTGGAAFNNMLYHETDAKALKVLNTGGNTTLDLSANISVSEIAGNISGSATSTGSFGYLNVDGDATIGGNLTFGDAATDYVSFAADISSSLIPDASDSFNLGSTSQRWNNLFLSGSLSASGGPVDIDSVTTVAIDSTTTTAINATTTMTVKGATGATFGDDTGTWEFDGSGALSETGMTTFSLTPSSTIDLDAGGAITIDGSAISLGTDADTAFDINTSTLDIDASDEITIDAGSSSGISLDASAASNFSTSAGALTLAGVTLDVDATGGAFNIAATAASTMTTSGGALTVDGKTGVDLKEDGTSVITVDTNRDTLFASTGGSTSDPDVEFDGYVRFDGVTEVTDTTDSTSVSTGAFIVDGGVGIAKDLVVGGMVTAQEFHSEFVSASILYMSGSSKFGDSIDDIHSFSGSIHQSGSFNLNDGNMTITDTLTATNIGAFTAAGAIDFGSQNMTNVDIDSGTVDGTTIGAASHTTIKGTTIDATTDFTIDGLVITADTITNDAVLEVVSTGLTLNASLDIALSADGGNVTMDDGTTTIFDFNTDDPEVKIHDDAQVANYASIAVGANGATTFTTVDTDAAAANLLFTVDGDITLDPAGNNVLPGGDSADDLGVSGTAWRALYVDSIEMNGQGAIAGVTHITASGNLEVAGNISGSVSTTGSFGRTSTTTLDLSSIVGNWTNAGNTIADLGSVTTADINGGTVDGTNVTVGSGKTLDVSGGTLTTSAAQKEAIMEGAGANIDIGSYDLRAATITPDGLTSGRVVFAGTNGVLSDDSDLTFSTATLTATNITGTTIKDFTTISGSAVSTGSFGDLMATGAGAAVVASSASLVSFRNNVNSQFGYLTSADTQATTVGVVAYNTSGNLTVSSVIDGGSF